MRPFYAALSASLCAVFSLSPLAYAQQAANPVELYAQSKRAGVPSQPLVVLTVSQALPVSVLPASCTDGALALATDGRTPVQSAGHGTGIAVRCQSNRWFSLSDGEPVQK